MNDLSLAELRLGLADVLAGTRQAAFDRTHASLIYRPSLQRLFDKLMALPANVLELPLVELLQAADGRRDGYGRALYHLRLAIEALPDKPASLAAVVTAITAFVPGLGVVRQPYGVAADSVTDDTQDLATHRAVLASVPTPDGRQLDAWVAAFIAGAEDIKRLLDDRSSALGVAATREGAGALRGEIVATLYELRGVLATERANRSELAATIDGEIFGQLDELQRLAGARNAAAAASKKAKAKPEAPEPIPAPTAPPSGNNP